jgi:hypothetical protein
MSSQGTSGPVAGPTSQAAPPRPSNPSMRLGWMVRWRRQFLLRLVPLAAAGEQFHRWRVSPFNVSRDNAYVVENIAPVGWYVSGQVVAQFNNCLMVHPRDPIARIDPVPFQIAVDEALSDYRAEVPARHCFRCASACRAAPPGAQDSSPRSLSQFAWRTSFMHHVPFWRQYMTGAPNQSAGAFTMSHIEFEHHTRQWRNFQPEYWRRIQQLS